jgi:hypothetical protein
MDILREMPINKDDKEEIYYVKTEEDNFKIVYDDEKDDINDVLEVSESIFNEKREIVDGSKFSGTQVVVNRIKEDFIPLKVKDELEELS